MGAITSSQPLACDHRGCPQISNSQHFKPKLTYQSATMRTNNSNAVMDEALAISLVLPIYYTKIALTDEEKTAATESWKLIISNRSLHFQEMKEKAKAKQEDFPFAICADYFSETFYQRLFNVHPDCKGLFANSKMKMRVNFMGIISLLLNAMEEDPNKFMKTLQHLAKVHNIIGVKAIEYGLGCEILMYSIQKSIGPTEWTSLASGAWTKIFSRILDVIIPVVIRFEIESRETAEEILSKRQLSQSASTHIISGATSNASSTKSVETSAPTVVPTTEANMRYC